MTTPHALRRYACLALLLVTPLLAQAGAMHKCVQGQTVVYSDKPCPSDQQVRVMTGGSVSTTEALPLVQQPEPLYYQRYSKPHVPYFARQKSVEEALKERSLKR